MLRGMLGGALLTVLPLVSTGTSAQVGCGLPGGYRMEQLERPALLSTSGLLALNALVGGVSVGLVRELRDGSFLEGFRSGALAGGVVFLGKAVAAQRFQGAGLAGRQLAAVGGSVASNAAAGEGALSRLELPLGPVRFSYARGSRATLRVDPLGVAVLTYAVLNPDLRLNAAASLSAGTPVFEGNSPLLVVPLSGDRAVGLEMSSVILLADMSGLDARTRADVFAHERVHTIQADAFQAYWGRALLEWLSPDSEGWRQAVGFLDVNLGKGTAELIDRLLARRGIWELEAEYIGR